MVAAEFQSWSWMAAPSAYRSVTISIRLSISAPVLVNGAVVVALLHSEGSSALLVLSLQCCSVGGVGVHSHLYRSDDRHRDFIDVRHLADFGDGFLPPLRVYPSECGTDTGFLCF